MAIPFVATVFLLFFAVWNAWEAEKAVTLAADQRLLVKERARNLNAFLSAIKDMETGQRGFLITGDESYLQPYHTGLSDLDISTMALNSWLGSDEEFKELWADVVDSVKLKKDELAFAIEIRRNEGLAAAQNTVRNEVGKLLMDDIREKIATVIASNAEMREESETLSKQSVGRSTTGINFLALAALATGLAGVITLITAMKAKAEAKEMELDKRRAERADKEKSNFLASMSHEIRTPLNAMLGFSELLENEVEGPRGKKYLQAIRTSGDGLANLINDILDLSKIESGVFELDFEPVIISDFAKALELMFSQKAMESGLGFSVTVEEECPDFLMMDELRVRQILTNLLGNAFKFTEVGEITVLLGAETITGSEEKVNFRASVADTGRGIPKEKLKEVFKPFKQVETGDEARGGTGLGLSICRRLAGLMNGQVKVKSTFGKGSTFSLLLKDVEIATRPESVNTGLSKDFNFDILKPSSILVVDDNPFNRDLVAGYLNGTKHKVIFATNGKEGVEQARRIKPDVILMDIRMPVMNGREAFEKLKHDKEPSISEIPIVAVTASSLLQQEHTLRRDFDGYLRKPFSRLQLVKALGEVLPRNPNPGNENTSYPDVSEDGGGSGNPAQWGKAVSMLRSWETDRLEDLRAAMALGEVVQFAKDLENLGEETECPVLRSYARALREHAESFEMTSTETTLQNFSSLVNEIEALSQSKG